MPTANLINDGLGGKKSRDGAPGRLRINALDQLTRLLGAYGMDNTNIRRVAYAWIKNIVLGVRVESVY